MQRQSLLSSHTACRNNRPMKSRLMRCGLGFVVATSLCADAAEESRAATNTYSAQVRPITVASYYFGNYHPGDARNTKLKGKDWSEWELVKAAKPRFSGHHQPNVPLWGYMDESDPRVMAAKIAAAAEPASCW